MEAKIEKLLKKILPQGWAEGTEAASEEELRKTVADSAMAVVAVNEAEKQDPDIDVLVEDLKNARSSYREVRQVETAKIKYCRELLKDRGKI